MQTLTSQNGSPTTTTTTTASRRFYVIDDGSKPPLSERKSLFDIPSSAVTFDYIPHEDWPKDIQIYMLMERCTKL